MFYKIYEAGLKWTQDKKKVEIINLSETETAKWVDLIKPLQTDYVTLYYNGIGAYLNFGGLSTDQKFNAGAYLHRYGVLSHRYCVFAPCFVSIMLGSSSVNQ